jgi:tetratricopeptide (TPR) repeat protein
MRMLCRAGLAGAALMMASGGAQAAPSALLRCDGRGVGPTPAEQPVGGEPTLISTPAAGEAPGFDRGAVEQGEAGLSACEEALRDPRIAANPVRRAELLMSLAIRNIELERYDAAVAAADTALAVPLPPLVRARFGRTTMPSLLLVKAFALVALGRLDEAEAQADAAARLRPWSDFVVQSATLVMSMSPAISPVETAWLDRLHRIRVARWRSSALIGAGRWRAAAADLAQLLPLRDAIRPLRLQTDLAVLLAIDGQTQAAAAAVASAEQMLAENDPAIVGNGGLGEPALARQILRLAQAQIALNRGEVEAARSWLLQNPTWWMVPAELAVPVATSFEAKAGEPASEALSLQKARERLKQSRSGDVYGDKMRTALMFALPRWQDPAAEAALARQVLPGPGAPQARRRKDGQAFTLASGKLVDEITGSEIMLLAAARAAAARGADRFAVVLTKKEQTGIKGMQAIVEIRLDLVVPGDPLFAGQESRALNVADVEAGLGTIVPPAVGQR